MQKLLLLTIATSYLCTASGQNVGIGTTSPSAKLHVAEGSVLFSAAGVPSIVPGNPPASGMGRRTMWYADKAAFRSGFVSNNAWDKDSIGYYSFAAGYDAKATDVGAIAFSHYAQARGLYSVAMGYNTKALGTNSVAFGLNALAQGDGAIAMGFENVAAGERSLALGTHSTASGDGAVALGSGVGASGPGTVAIGNSSQATNMYAAAFGYGSHATGTSAIAIGPVTASGNGSIAIGGGGASTNGKNGAMVITDSYSNPKLNSSADYQLSMRFVGGYRFYTTSDLSTGVQLAFGGGSWTAISDQRKKENFRALDKEDVLQKVASLPITDWNYKAQPKTQRHIGPMAQDFYAAFHLDGVGADTTINTMDISGVNMVAIQALERRTTDLKKENETLKAVNEKLAAEIAGIKASLQKLEKSLQPF